MIFFLHLIVNENKNELEESYNQIKCVIERKMNVHECASFYQMDCMCAVLPERFKTCFGIYFSKT